MSTNPESSETWAALAAATKPRISKYQSQNNLLHEDKFQPLLNAFVDWIPEGGREFVARYIVNASTNEDLYDVSRNLLTGLVAPSKSRVL